MVVSSLEPYRNLVATNNRDSWEIVGNSPCFRVKNSPGQPVCGFVLFKLHLSIDDNDRNSRCFGSFSNGEFDISLPISLKGNINQILVFSKPVLDLYFQPGNFLGVIKVYSFSMATISYMESRYRMWRRVVPALLSQPKSIQRYTKLSPYLAVSNITKAYELASGIRAGVGEILYDQWIYQFDARSQNDRKKIARRSIELSNKVSILIVVIGDDDSVNSDWGRTFASISNQLCDSLRVIAVSDDDLNSGLKIILADKLVVVNRENTGSLLEHCQFKKDCCGVVVVTAGVVLADHLVYWYLKKYYDNSNLKVIYSDHDSIDESGNRINPIFKPDWSIELCFSGNYIGEAYFLSFNLFFKLWEVPSCVSSSSDVLYGLLLRASAAVDSQDIGHITAILFHVFTSEFLDDRAEIVSSKKELVLKRHLDREGIKADVAEKKSVGLRIDYHIPSQDPLVTIIIPTKDALNYLEPCVSSVLKKTKYKNFELIIVDNQSLDDKTFEFFAEIKKIDNVSVIVFDQPFNYSRINNFAVNQAKGQIICLLNNDTEIISEDWLGNMVGHLFQHDVGVVGAKLYFSDGRVQHAGDSFGPGGCAGHFHSLIAGDDPGYCNRADLSQDLSAVTAACLLTWTNLYVGLGGLDERNLPVAFNDVDYCLRVRESGKRVVFTPDAKLYHYESVSRGKDETPEKVKRAKMERDYMRKRWSHLLCHDPFYNPNLSYVRPDFSLSHSPLVRKPW